jgi:hypothetical protein
VVSVDEHDGAQGEAHDEEGEGLQAVEVAHVVPPAKRRIKITAAWRRREARCCLSVMPGLPQGCRESGPSVRVLKLIFNSARGIREPGVCGR